MFTVLSNTRNSHLYVILALAITLIVIFTFAVAPSIAAPRPAIMPATGSQNAYVEFLRGEKAIYANPVGLSDALSAWRFGEKASYTKAGLSWPPRPNFWPLREKSVAPASYRSPTDECFDVPLREVAQCRNAIQTPVP